MAQPEFVVDIWILASHIRNYNRRAPDVLLNISNYRFVAEDLVGSLGLQPRSCRSNGLFDDVLVVVVERLAKRHKNEAKTIVNVGAVDHVDKDNHDELSSAGGTASLPTIPPPQLASAGLWTTTITLVNTGSTSAQALLNFFGDTGSPLSLPWTFPQLSGTASSTTASTIQQTLNPGAQLVLQTTGPASQPVTEGWAQLLTNGSITGFAIFSAQIGNSVQDSVAPLETRNASGYIIPFDNTNGSALGIAIANLTVQSLNTTVNIRDDTGAQILTSTISLPAIGHTSFVLTTQFGSVVAQRRGTVEFKTPSPGQTQPRS